VVFGGPLTLGQLAVAEQVKPPTMTRIVTGLEKDGLVRRRGDLQDRRLTLIQATDKGRAVLAAGRARRVEKLASAVRRLTSSELAELARATQLLEEIIGSMRGQSDSSRRERMGEVQRRQRRTT
jgi:DNA-binding MarR family transcriptional regulator